MGIRPDYSRLSSGEMIKIVTEHPDEIQHIDAQTQGYSQIALAALKSGAKLSEIDQRTIPEQASFGKDFQKKFLRVPFRKFYKRNYSNGGSFF